MINIILKLFGSKKEKNNYKEYIKIQYDRSLSKYNEGNCSDAEKKRKDEFNNLISDHYDFINCKSALVVGCRNSYELDLLEKKGAKRVLGVDLFSFDERIKVIDMHNMNIFEDNSFDFILSSHSLEHSYDYEKVIIELYRVLNNEGILAIEVPVNYETRGADLHDFKSADNLINIIRNIISTKTILFAQNVSKENNNSGTDITRVIISVNK